MQLLVTRMAEEATKDPSIRGFIRTSELMLVLSFETTSPNEQQVKQIVRRMRRMFCREGVGNLIEARPRFGYRLAVVPKQLG
jgi:DNA-binding winged helix-turn-helix (wHTH) protein